MDNVSGGIQHIWRGLFACDELQEGRNRQVAESLLCEGLSKVLQQCPDLIFIQFKAKRN